MGLATDIFCCYIKKWKYNENFTKYFLDILHK